MFDRDATLTITLSTVKTIFVCNVGQNKNLVLSFLNIAYRSLNKQNKLATYSNKTLPRLHQTPPQDRVPLF